MWVLKVKGIIVALDIVDFEIIFGIKIGDKMYRNFSDSCFSLEQLMNFVL